VYDVLPLVRCQSTGRAAIETVARGFTIAELRAWSPDTYDSSASRKSGKLVVANHDKTTNARGNPYTTSRLMWTVVGIVGLAWPSCSN
jgi:hypothetical protein